MNEAQAAISTSLVLANSVELITRSVMAAVGLGNELSPTIGGENISETDVLVDLALSKLQHELTGYII